MKKAVIYVFVVMLWICPCLAGENIYTWTDKNGVKRFSDRPPEDVKHYETIVVSPEESDGESSDGSRPEYDQMIESIRQEKQQTEQKSIQAETDRAAKGELDAKTRKKERIEAELKQLRQKLDDAKKRQVNRGYSQSQKNARIGEIEKQLDKLKNSPDEYFQGK